MGFYDAFIAVKSLIVRTENLRNIVDILIDELKTNPTFTVAFLSGRSLRYDDLKPFFSDSLLQNNCFGESNDFSVEYLTNHINQLRNMFLTNNNFTYASLRNPNLRIQKALLREMQHFSIKNVYFDPNYTIKLYFSSVKRISTSIATRLYSFRKKLKKLQSKIPSNKRARQRAVRLANRIKRMERFLARFLDVQIPFAKISEFKKKRDIYLNRLKPSFTYNITDSLITRVFELKFLNPKNSNVKVLRSIFKPFISRRIRSVSIDSFRAYINANLRYSIIETFRTQMVNSSDFVSLIIDGLKRIKSTLYKEMTPPSHTTFSIRLVDPWGTIRSPLFPIDEKNNRAKFDPNVALNDPELYSFRLSFIEREFLNLSIRDGYSRLESLLQAGFTPAAPTITFRNRKLKLHLPLTKKKEIASSKSEKIIKKIMGVDLGLKHFGVLSLRDMQTKKEFTRFFLDATTLFDKKFNSFSGKFDYQQIWNGTGFISRHDVPSNITQRIINIRAEIRATQRKKNLYEQRLLQRGITRFRTKRKWNDMRRKISVLWDRIDRINEQIVHNLAHAIVVIAKFYEIDEIRVEDLRWSHHAKKRKVGRFLAFWQTHWFFSQVQTAVADLCASNGLSQPIKIPAAYTSQRCSKCGATNENSKSKVVLRNSSINGKKYTGIRCTKCGFRLNADLNASRILTQYVYPSEQASTVANCVRSNRVINLNNCNNNKKDFTCSRFP